MTPRASLALGAAIPLIMLALFAAMIVWVPVHGYAYDYALNHPAILHIAEDDAGWLPQFMGNYRGHVDPFAPFTPSLED